MRFDCEGCEVGASCVDCSGLESIHRSTFVKSLPYNGGIVIHCNGSVKVTAHCDRVKNERHDLLC